MSRWYVDTSVAAHAVLPDGNVAALEWIDTTIAEGDEIYASTLLRLELVRTLRREGLPTAWVNAMTGRVEEISVTDAVLRSAGAIEPHVRALDAIHLASCLLLGGEARLATHDQTMLTAARAIGITATDPLAPAQQ